MREDIFVKGAIPLETLMIAKEQLASNGHIGAQSIFMGHIRADEIEKSLVTGIDYSAYEPMALNQFESIIEKAKASYDLTDVIIRHSLGIVGISEASLMVITLSKHRRASLDGLNMIVEAIKADVPIFGKEILEEGQYKWKENK